MKNRWTPDEIAILNRLYGRETITNIANLLNRPWGSVAQKAHKLGLTDATRGKETWTPGEIKFLKDNFATLSNVRSSCDCPIMHGGYTKPSRVN